ncbi:MAG: type II toxin-antitoxin system VapB family antitoxin [Deltaproteobacteria bacterium]|nr:type II toxin-antitoxin system VapB family antitoxin [Deltaproteobacteria bacterium]
MRTTLVLDDELVRAAKSRSIELKITLSELVNRALRAALSPRRDTPEPPFHMPTYGPDEPQVAHEPADFHQALEEEDGSSLSRK